MLEPKRVVELEVYCDGTPVARLVRTAAGCEFRYDEPYLASGGQAIARHLPVSGLEVKGATNLPSFFAGLLPEGIMQRAIVRTHRLSEDDLFSQLAVAGQNAVGDVTVRVPDIAYRPPPRTVDDAIGLLKALQDRLALPPSPSLSGVQPKLSIGDAVASQRGEIAIVKIEPTEYPGILQNEAFFMRLAAKCGIRVPKVRLRDEALIVERFDRVKRPGAPPAQLHVEDALQVMDKYPLAKYSLDYLEILDAAAALGVGKSVLLDLLRLYAYSYVILNGDLHAKNVSFFFLREGGWIMTPAYDLVCTLPYAVDYPYGRHMALPLDEQYADFKLDDLVAIGIKYGLPERAVVAMLRQVSQGVIAGIEAIYEGFPKSITAEIQGRAKAIA